MEAHDLSISEYEAARRRLQKRAYIKRARQSPAWSSSMEVSLQELKAEDPEEADRDHEICRRWQEVNGFSFY